MSPFLLPTILLPLKVSQDIHAASYAIHTDEGCITKYVCHELQP